MSKPWHRYPPGLKQRILERDNHECQIKLPGCLGIGVQIDHILPPSRGGAWFDPLNLRAGCPPCNLARRSLYPRRPPGSKIKPPPERW